MKMRNLEKKTVDPVGSLLTERMPSYDAGPRAGGAATLRALWDARRFLAKATLIGGLAGLLSAFAIPKYYTAVTRLMPPDNQSPSLAMLSAMSGRGGSPLGSIPADILGLKSSGALFVGIMKSQTVQDRLVDQFGLQEVYGESLREDTRRRLADNTLVVEDRKSGIISISVTDRDPIRAANLANAYASHLNKLITELTTSAAHRERVFIEGRLLAVKRDLDAAAGALSDYSSRNVALDLKEQGRAMVLTAATLQGQLIAAESELESIRETYSDNNVRVRAVQARIAELKKQLSKFTGSGGAQPVGSNSEAAYHLSLRDLPLLAVKYSELYRNAKVHETVFELLTQQLELAKVQEAKETPSVKIVDVATAPERHSFPARLLIAAAGTSLGLTVAVAWIVTRMRWKAMTAGDPVKELFLDVSNDVRGAWRAARQRGFSRGSRASVRTEQADSDQASRIGRPES